MQGYFTIFCIFEKIIIAGDIRADFLKTDFILLFIAAKKAKTRRQIKALKNTT